MTVHYYNIYKFKHNICQKENSFKLIGVFPNFFQVYSFIELMTVDKQIKTNMYIFFDKSLFF